MTDMNIACFLFKGIVKQKPKQLFHIPLISAAVFFDPDKSLLLDSPFINRFECKSINFIFSEIFIFNFCSFQPMILDWTSQVCMKEFNYGKMFIDSCERSTFLFTGFLMLNEIWYKLFKISLIAASFWKDNLWMIESKAPYYFCLHYLPLLWLWNPSMVNFLPHWSFVFLEEFLPWLHGSSLFSAWNPKIRKRINLRIPRIHRADFADQVRKSSYYPYQQTNWWSGKIHFVKPYCSLFVEYAS